MTIKLNNVFPITSLRYSLIHIYSKLSLFLNQNCFKLVRYSYTLKSTKSVVYQYNPAGIQEIDNQP